MVRQTTTLRNIGGFVISPPPGFFGRREMTSIPPHKSKWVNTVSQRYALFPTSTCLRILPPAHPLGSGLLRPNRRSSCPSRDPRPVMEMLQVYQPQGLLKSAGSPCPAGSSSGWPLPGLGQTAPRSCCWTNPWARGPEVCARIMQNELKRSPAGNGITFIYVTHDQEEPWPCLTQWWSWTEDRISRLAHRRTSTTNRKNAFVADFIGESNIMTASCAGRCGGNFLTGSSMPGQRGLAGLFVDVVIRPERTWDIVPEDQAKGTVTSVTFKGPCSTEVLLAWFYGFKWADPDPPTCRR